MTDHNEPLVSICCITYNHEKYIADAINGFLMQKTTFPFEIIIHDDASTDATRDVILKYQAEHPELIRTIFQTENQYSQGKHAFPVTFTAAKGKYIALCEGDDYWIDPYKLQKQVDFLEDHPEYVICYHNFYYYEDNEKKFTLGNDNPWDTYTLEDVIEYNVYYSGRKTTIPSHTSTVVFLKNCVVQIPKWCNEACNIDIPLFIHISRFGLSKFLNDTMSVWRIIPTGLSSNQNGSSFMDNRARMYKAINRELHHRYGKIINPIISRIYLRSIIYEIKHDKRKKALTYLMKAIFSYPRDTIYFLRKYNYQTYLHRSSKKQNLVHE